MNQKIKYWIKKQKKLYLFLNIFIRFKLKYVDRFVFNCKKKLRKMFGFSISKNDIRNLKNKHKKERCFIIATGPSLKIEDIQLLKDEVTIGMNSLCKIFKELGWETTYYGVQDYEVYRLLEDEIGKIKNSSVLAADILNKRYKLRENYIQYPLNLLNHSVTLNHPFNTFFSDDAYLTVFDGYTITYSLIQIAVYMGFKEIYLLGVDRNYSDKVDESNFINIGKIDNTYSQAGERMKFSYSMAKDYADKNNIKIINATRGGMLEVFPRVNLDVIVQTRINT